MRDKFASLGALDRMNSLSRLELTAHQLHAELLWVFLLSVLGVTMAIPMKRQMINVEQLRFPSGIAAAETLRALHSVGAKAARSAKALFLKLRASVEKPLSASGSFPARERARAS